MLIIQLLYLKTLKTTFLEITIYYYNIINILYMSSKHHIYLISDLGETIDKFSQ